MDPLGSGSFWAVGEVPRVKVPERATEMSGPTGSSADTGLSPLSAGLRPLHQLLQHEEPHTQDGEVGTGPR